MQIICMEFFDFALSAKSKKERYDNALFSLSKKFESSLKLKHRVSKGITSLWSGQGLTALVGGGAKPHI